MLVIISDLHLTDGTSGSTISPGAFALLGERLSTTAAERERVADPGAEDDTPSSNGAEQKRLVLSAFADAIDAYCVNHGLEYQTVPPGMGPSEWVRP